MWTGSQGRGALVVVIPDPSFPVPNSQDRRYFAQLKDEFRAAPTLMIVVTASPLLQSVITAVSWLSPQAERFRTSACPTFAETLARAEAFRATSATALQGLERALRSSAARRVGVRGA